MPRKARRKLAPEKVPNAKREYELITYVNEDERADVLARAESLGISVSTYIRMALRRDLYLTGTPPSPT